MKRENEMGNGNNIFLRFIVCHLFHLFSAVTIDKYASVFVVVVVVFFQK